MLAYLINTNANNTAASTEMINAAQIHEGQRNGSINWRRNEPERRGTKRKSVVILSSYKTENA